MVFCDFGVIDWKDECGQQCCVWLVGLVIELLVLDVFVFDVVGYVGFFCVIFVCIRLKCVQIGKLFFGFVFVRLLIIGGYGCSVFVVIYVCI